MRLIPLLVLVSLELAAGFPLSGHVPTNSPRLISQSTLSPCVSQPTLTICKRNSWCNDIASNGRTTPMTLRGGKDSANGSQGANSIASIFSSGEAQLLIVAALYGSLTVSFRLLYGTEGPPAPSMASLVRGIIAAACFVPTIMKKPTTEEESKGRGASLFLAALELSWWNAGAQGLQNAGLIFTEASRASFLTQTSVVLTPILSLFFGEKVGGNVWGACVLALFGVVTISRAESPAAAAAAAAHASAGINIGDLLCLAGAACWSMYILRLTQMMQSGKHCATALQAYKTCLLAGWYAVWVAYDAATVVGGMSALWPAAGSLLPLAIICYSAIGPGAVADVMQSRAQEKVKASQANVILSAEPLMAALLGMLLLGERLSVSAGAGGLAIVVASLLASGVIAKNKSSL